MAFTNFARTFTNPVQSISPNVEKNEAASHSIVAFIITLKMFLGLLKIFNRSFKLNYNYMIMIKNVKSNYEIVVNPIYRRVSGKFELLLSKANDIFMLPLKLYIITVEL